jgi:hypothetical protein
MGKWWVRSGKIDASMSKVIHLVQRARLEIRDVWSLCALCGNSVSVSLRYDSPLPENATEDRSKVTCRSCLMGAHNIPVASPTVLPRLVTAFDVVRAGKVQPSPDSPGKVLYEVDDISFLMRAPAAH